MAYPDLWGEGTALVDISIAGGGAGVNFSAAITGLTPDLGDRPMESIHCVRGTKLKTYKPEEDTTIEFEGYPTNLDTTSTDVLQRFFCAWASKDTSQPLQTYNNLMVHNNFRVTILWTKAPGATTAVSQVLSTAMGGGEFIRFVAKNCTLISVKPVFTDNELKFTFKFKVCSQAKNTTLGGTFETGATSMTQNLMWQSSDGSTTVIALGNYIGAW